MRAQALLPSLNLPAAPVWILTNDDLRAHASARTLAEARKAEARRHGVPAAGPPYRRRKLDGIESVNTCRLKATVDSPFHRFRCIEMLLPMPGVYGLSNAREWVFVGASYDIRATLMDHLGKAIRR